MSYTEHWKPETDQQRALMSCPFSEIFVGGGRGAGKTDALIGHWLQHAERYEENAQGIFFRRRFKQVQEIGRRCAELLPKLGSEYDKANAAWIFRNGASLRLRHLWDENDAYQHAGRTYSWMAFDDVEQWDDPGPLNQMRGCLRSHKPGLCQILLAGDDGKPAEWVRDRYISPAPVGWKMVQDEHGIPYVYIPTR